MKATLEFNFPEDNQEYLITVKANDMANFIFDLVYNSKKSLYANLDDIDIEQGIDLTFQKIYELLEKHSIDIDELID
jgi:chaperonin GroEL (HSP60 family)